MAEHKTGCCPVGSEPQLAATHIPTGKEETIDGLPLYTVGSGDKAIIFIFDVFGPDAGRTKLICDQLADAGFFVILPDFFRKDPWNSNDFSKIGEFFQKWNWDVLNKDLENVVYPYLEKRGTKSIGMVGCCWGDYVVVKASASGKITAAVGFHPTLNYFGPTIEELTEAVKCPQFYMPAGNDPEELKEGGSAEKILKEKFGEKGRVKTFPDVQHGWVPRGDIQKPEVAKAYKEAVTLAIEYFKELL